MNRRRTIRRRWRFASLFARAGNRRVRPKRKAQTVAQETVESAAAPRAPRDLRAALARAISGVLRVALLGVKVLLIVALLGAALVGGYHTYRRVMTSTYFHLRHIEIRETRRAPTEQIRELLQPERGKNILALDLGALRRTVLGHPWVRDARIERVLPDRLVVQITEHRPRALLLIGHLYLIDRAGEVFKQADREETDGLPVITGISRMSYLNEPRRARARIEKALATLDRYYDTARPQLSEVHISKRGEVTLFLRHGGLALRLGEGITDQRLAKLDAVWTALGPEVRQARAIFLDNVVRKDRVTVRMAHYH